MRTPYATPIVENPSPTAAQLAAYTHVVLKTPADALDFDWTALTPGSLIELCWNPDPYRIKVTLDTHGTREKQLILRGLPGPEGQRPIIDGDGARQMNKVPGLEQNCLVGIHGDWITVEGLEIRNANGHHSYTDLEGGKHIFNGGARAIFFDAGSHVTIRNNDLHHCGNGLFSYAPTFDMLVEYNYIHENGVPSTEAKFDFTTKQRSMLDHNSYCATVRTTYQFNHYGPLLHDAWGYNLKDRGSGTVIRYNVIHGGRRPISLDDGQDDVELITKQPDYNDTYVFGNVLIKRKDADNLRLWGDDEIIHFGGDDKSWMYRSGTLFFYHNTVVTYRKAGMCPMTPFYGTTAPDVPREERTTLFYLPGHRAEDGVELSCGSVDARNNIVVAMSDGSYDAAPIALMGFSGALRKGEKECLFQQNLVYSPGGWATTLDRDTTCEPGREAALFGVGEKAAVDNTPTAIGDNTYAPAELDPQTLRPTPNTPLPAPAPLHPICQANQWLQITREPLGGFRKDNAVGAYPVQGI